MDFSKAPAIQELPVNSAICIPSDGSHVPLKNGCFEVKGYAWSGGGRKVVRVDVSSDGGKTWHAADLIQDSSPLYRCWSWTLWKVSSLFLKFHNNLNIYLIFQNSFNGIYVCVCDLF